MTLKAKAVLAVPVFALLAALAAPAGAFAAAPGGPTAGTPPAPAVQQKAPPAPGAERKAQAPQAPTAIPVPEIVRRAEEVAKLLRDLEALAAPLPAIDAIQARLPDVSARLGPELGSTIEALKHDLPLTILDRLTQSWQVNRLEVTGWVEVLTKRATQLEDAMDQLAGLRARWTQTRADARASRAPAAVVQRVDAVRADIEAGRARLQAQRAATLVLQDGVAQEVARCQDALARIDQVRQAAVGRMFVRNTLPIWSSEVRGRRFEELSAGVREAAGASIAQLRRFIGDQSIWLLLQGLLFIGLVLLARAGRRRARGRCRPPPCSTARIPRPPWPRWR